MTRHPDPRPSDPRHSDPRDPEAFAALPKVELHLHLEGAAPPDFIRMLAKEKHVDLSRIFDDRGGYRFDGFTDFLRIYEAATSVLTRPEDYARLTRAVLEESAAQGVIYCETFLSPDFCGGRDLVAWREFMAAIHETALEAARWGAPEWRGIVTCIRHFGPDKARETALCAAETAGGFITGFGIAGDEGVGRPADFGWSFDCAREAGLGLTAHAGEWGGPDGIRDTITALRPQRLGHGVRAIEDMALVDALAEAGTVLEVCPGSNIALGLYPGWRAHPIAELDRRGVRVTVSTDDPPFFHTTLTREYARLAEAFDWDEGQFARLNRTALAAAFCDEDTRTRLAARLE